MVENRRIQFAFRIARLLPPAADGCAQSGRGIAKSVGQKHGDRLVKARGERDLPPLKWSSVRYDFDQEDRINGQEAAYS